MNSQNPSLVLPALNNPDRITKKEVYMNSLIASILDPNQNLLEIPLSSPLLSNYWVPETFSSKCKTGSRELDAIRYINNKQPGSRKSSNIITIFEYKKGVVSTEHLIQTLYIKDYPNCVINGTNKSVRSSNNPLRNLYTKAQLALKRLSAVQEVVVVIMGDRISIEAANLAEEINKNKKYLYRASNKQQIPIRVVLRTYKDFMYNSIIKKHKLEWNHAKGINQQILNMSEYNKGSLTFEKWSGDKMLGYYKPQELMPF